MSSKIKKSLLALSILASSLSYADDIDIILAPKNQKVNMMFVMDLTASMYNLVPGSDIDGSPELSRLQVLKQAFKDTVNGYRDGNEDLTDPDDFPNGVNDFDNFNFGLSFFGGFEPDSGDRTGNFSKLNPATGLVESFTPNGLLSNIAYPLSSLAGASAQADLSNDDYIHPGTPINFIPDAGTLNTREYLTDYTDTWGAYVWTPLVDAYYENALYYRGEQVNAGNVSPDSAYSSHPTSYVGTVGSTTNPPTYISPIDECATNNIVLLTDGQPTHNSVADNIGGMIDDATCDVDNPGGDRIGEHGRCAVELAKFLSEENQSDVFGDDVDRRTINTYTIGFGIRNRAALTLLDDIAIAGGTGRPEIDTNGNTVIDTNGNIQLEGVYDVQSSEKLVQAFADIVKDAGAAADSSRTFSAPAVSVDTSTLLSNTDTVYVPVFDRADGLWVGNLKKFKFDGDGLVDSAGNSAIDATGALLPTAEDEWATGVVDSLETGGAASNIPDAADRDLYTNIGDNLDVLDDGVLAAKFELTGLIDPDDEIARDSLIDFISGENPLDGSKRNYMGSIIHSEPVELEYSSGEKRVFIGTNEGFLHAIDDATGDEVYAFMPDELLPNITKQYLVDTSIVPSDDYIYGVDSPMTLWINDGNNNSLGDGILNNTTESAYLFFGLRRGGGSYTALDVTDPDAPDVAWNRTFGTGDSWSEPVVDYFKWGNVAEARPVVIVGGGYNDASGRETAGGNDVYIIDALSGNIVWQASQAIGSATNFNARGAEAVNATGLPNGVPAKVKAIDVDKDGSIDRLYFGDTGGNIWRADLNEVVNNGTLHRVAALGGTGANGRQFFESPDVAVFENNGQFVTSIAIGSGDRTNPLSTSVDDKFYLLFDNAMFRSPTETDDPLITMAANGGLQELELAEGDQTAEGYRGWYKSLADSEKVLSTPTIFQGFIIFNSFGVVSVDESVCTPDNQTNSTLYVLDLLAGIEVEEPETVESTGVIPPDPAIVLKLVDGDGAVVTDATVCDTTPCSIAPQIINGTTFSEVPPPISTDDIPVGVATSGVPYSAIERVYWINQ